MLIKLFQQLMMILADVRHHNVFKTLRELTIRVFMEANENESTCQVEARFEATLWVDGLSPKLLDTFHDIMLQANRSPDAIFINVARSWKNAGFDWPVETHAISKTLLMAVQTIQQFTGAFTLFLVQVILRIILHSECPLVLAALVLDNIQIETECHVAVTSLANYLTSLVQFDSVARADRKRRLLAVLNFFPGHYLVIMRALHDVNDGSLLVPLQDFPSQLPDELSNREVLCGLLHCAQVMDASTKTFCCHGALRFVALCATGSDSFPWRRIRSSLESDQFSYLNFVSLLSTGSLQNTLFSVGESSCDELFLLLQSDYLPTTALLEIGISRLELFVSNRHGNGSKNSDYLFLIHVSEVLSKRQFSHESIEEAKVSDFLKNVLSVWNVLGNDDSNKLDQKLVCAIQSAIVRILSSEAGYLAVMAFDAKLIVTKSLSYMQCNNFRREECLLSALVRYDRVLFGSQFMAAHESLAQTEPYRSNCMQGKLDFVLYAFVEDVFKHGLSFPDNFLRLIDNRASYLASHLHLSTGLLHEFVVLLFSLKDTFDEKHLNLFPGVLEFLGAIIQTFPEKGKNGSIDVAIEVAAIFCNKDALRGCTKVLKLQHSLRDLSLRRLCSQIRTRLRCLSKSSFRNEDEGCQTCLSIIRTLRGIIDNISESNQSHAQDATFLGDAVKAYLRFSICSDSDGLTEIRVEVVSLLYHLLKALKDGRTIGGLNGESGSKMIFELTTTHSRFSSFGAYLDNATCERLQTTLFAMLRLCLEMQNEVTFERSTWLVFWRAYNGSPSGKDTLTFNIMDLYAKTDKDVSASLLQQQPTLIKRKQYPNMSFLLMRNFRPSPSQDHSSWDWLLDFITRPRIEKTLSDFPLRLNSFPDLKSVKVEYVDERYNPDFVIRLTLAAVQQLNRIKSEEIITLFAKALCDKGLLGLSLAALCCQSKTTRKACFALLGLFEDIICCESAKRLQSWKDRPQQLMLVRSVRYSCCIQLASTNTSTDTFLETSIAPFTAIYLARASLILSHPSHPLYEAINRSILSTEKDAGAFQDISRLPGFLVLFCSTSTDVEQLRFERVFALRLLRDGFVTKDSFSYLAKCRAPEILMASIYTPPPYPTFHERLNEHLLIVDIFEKILLFSVDDLKLRDFIGRVGFFSWLRCALMSRENYNHQYYAKLLRLLSSALSTRFDVITDFEQMTCGLANAVVEKTLEFVLSTRTGEVSTRAIHDVLTSCCVALVSIEGTISSEKRASLDYGQGIDVKTTAHFIDALLNFNIADEAIYTVLCSLPFHNNQSGFWEKAEAVQDGVREGHAKLCKTLLSSMLCNSDSPGVIMCRAVLRRVSDLLDLVECSQESEIRQKLLSVRRKCTKDEEARSSWCACFSQF